MFSSIFLNSILKVKLPSVDFAILVALQNV